MTRELDQQAHFNRKLRFLVNRNCIFFKYDKLRYKANNVLLTLERTNDC